MKFFIFPKRLYKYLFIFLLNLFQMSAGSQISMASQSTVNSVHTVHYQDSNMSILAHYAVTRKRITQLRSVHRRQRERGTEKLTIWILRSWLVMQHQLINPELLGLRKKRAAIPKHVGSSPIRHCGAKSPSPQQTYPMVSDTKVRTFLIIFNHLLALDAVQKMHGPKIISIVNNNNNIIVVCDNFEC